MATRTASPVHAQQGVSDNEVFTGGRRPPRPARLDGRARPLPDKTGDAPVDASKPNERQIKIWKYEIRTLKRDDRRGRYEMGKRLAAIQAERAKAKVGTFTTVDLKELKITIWTAYRLIKFCRRVEARIAANLLQFAKDQKRFPVMTVEEEEEHDKRLADAEVAALDKVIDAEDRRIKDLQKKGKKNHARDYRVVVTFKDHKQRERFKQKWLSLDEQVRSKLVYKAVTNAKDTN
jgi:midasin (ATPase involved in ribosome maturation)